MILVSLELSNYKQYAGTHQIDFPSEGAIAIIGNNGAGKTTLFEAIEWCLYSPREIVADSLLTRGGIGEPGVRLVIEDPRDGVRYVIERRRKRRSVEAEVYKESDPGSPLVTGTRDVTDFITRRLIGLGHRAFVSTFFTRQKELSFFGELRETERRREVAQLLGFETIRVAQGLLGDERTAARNDATSLARQYDEALRDRDFAVERETVAALRAATTAAVGVALEAQTLALAAVANTRLQREQMVVTAREDAALAQQLTRLQGQLAAAETSRAGADRELTQLQNQLTLRDSLLPTALTEPHLRDLLAGFAHERERHAEAVALDRDLLRADQAIADAPEMLRSILRAVPDAGTLVPAWTAAAASPDPPANATQFLAVIAKLDPAAARLRALHMSTAHRAATDVAEHETSYQTALAAHASLVRDHSQLLSAGDPATQVAAANLARDTAQTQQAETAERGTLVGELIKEREAVIANIQSAAAAPSCPVCQRPLSLADSELAIEPLREKIASLVDEKARLSDAYRQAGRALRDARAALETAQSRLGTLRELDGQLRSAVDYVAQREAALTAARAGADQALARAGVSSAPTPEDAAAANRDAEVIAAIVGQREALAQLLARTNQAIADRHAAAAARARVGPVAYDAAAHDEARSRHEAAANAAARIAQIEQSLLTRPEVESRRAAALTQLATISDEITATVAARAALAFDQAALDSAYGAEDDARAAAVTAEQNLGAARQAERDAQRDERDLLAEQDRITSLDRRAQGRKREWDELERMYKEFGRFDQYVAQLVTPELANYTGELLAEVTDRKYDQVYFDQNYGLHIYDGPEAFPISHFSGGERDVAALCARLSLSRFIGAQAAHPPRFLVLDEVFGSLDADRRHHLLDALLHLAGADGPFRQLFIISHVDDVRGSPALDEIWRVREQNGGSVIDNVSRTGAVEEF